MADIHEEDILLHKMQLVLRDGHVTQGHYLLGLRILHMLVAEFNQPTAGRTMTLHRKLAVAFRDASLFKVFQVAIAAMQQLQSNATADEKLREQVCSPQPHT